jgi:hypothetical protein
MAVDQGLSAQGELVMIVTQSITARQLKFIKAIAADKGLDDEAVEAMCQARFGLTLLDLDRRQGSELIQAIQDHDG